MRLIRPSRLPQPVPPARPADFAPCRSLQIRSPTTSPYIENPRLAPFPNKISAIGIGSLQYYIAQPTPVRHSHNGQISSLPTKAYEQCSHNHGIGSNDFIASTSKPGHWHQRQVYYSASRECAIILCVVAPGAWHPVTGWWCWWAGAWLLIQAPAGVWLPLPACRSALRNPG